MPEYVLLLNWTEEGLERVIPVPEDPTGGQMLAIRERLDGKLRRFNAGVVSMHWTLGPYDMVALVEADSEAIVGGVTLWLAQTEHLRTTTMRAFGARDMAAVRQGGSPADDVADANASVTDVLYRCHY